MQGGGNQTEHIRQLRKWRSDWENSGPRSATLMCNGSCCRVLASCITTIPHQACLIHLHRGLVHAVCAV
jgi:hypothetical protein